MRSPAHVYNAPTVIPAAMEGMEPVLLSFVCQHGGDGGLVRGVLIHVTEGTTESAEGADYEGWEVGLPVS